MDLNGNSNDNLVTFNKIFDNLRGLDMDAVDRNLVRSNRVTNNDGHGIFLSSGSAQNNVISNFVSGNARSVVGAGIENCVSCPGNAFRYNIVERTHRDPQSTSLSNGVGMVLDGVNGDVRGNRGSRNQASGLLVVGTGRTVSKNVFNHNADDGICAVSGNTDGGRNRGRHNGGVDVAFGVAECPVP